MNMREVDDISLFHFHVTQISRAAGQSAIASAAYRAGEKLHSDYYGEDSDYTGKSGVRYSEILLPPHAPERLRDREILWNEVERAERRKDAQLAYSFDIALQNELSFEENLELAKQFLQENFVAAGMIVDFAIHDPERNGTQNPHFHVMAPIRPLNPDGTWGAKQRMVYRLDEDGQRIQKSNGKYAVDAVPTTDWGRPETLDRWREAWADLVNQKLDEKGLDYRIDHRSYADQAVDLLPTVHEGVAVRQMEQRGIRTEKGDLNRWIKVTNRMLQALKKKLTSLKQWIDGIQIELVERDTSPNLVTLLSDYYAQRNQGTLTFSRYAGQKARVNNLKAFSETVNFLQANKLYTLEDLKQKIAEVHAQRQPLQDTVKANSKRIKELQELQRHAEAYAKTKPIHDQLQQIKFKKRREQFQQAHEPELRRFYLAKRKLAGYGEPFPIKEWKEECTKLHAESEATAAQANRLWQEVRQLIAVQHLVNTALHEKPEHEKEPQQRLPDRR